MSDEIDYLGTDYYTGWIDDQDAVAEVVSQLTYQDIDQTPIGDISTTDLPKTVFLWKFCDSVTKQKDLKVEDQGNVGACVSFGTARAIEYSNIVEIAHGDSEEFRYLSRPVIYAGSRVEVNGGRSPFRSDGSVGAWAAKFVKDWGCLDQSKYEGYDLSKYSASETRTWGATGVPDKLEPLLKNHKVNQTTMVTTIEQAMKSLANGFAFAVCSNQGFNTKRDNNGICAPSGVWNHCMMCKGYTYIKDVLYFVLENSWNGYLGSSNPLPEGCNLGSFFIKDAVMARMLAQKDSFAFAGFNGFKVNDYIDWSF